MADWMDEYPETEDLNERYRLLRTEMARLRGQRDDIEFYDRDAVGRDVRRLNETIPEELIVFAANDFGLPLAYRPTGVTADVQNEIREAILQNKYDDSHEDLNEIRRELLNEHPGIHKVLVAVHTEGTIRYHLPEGSKETTNFITVREMVGLVDYTTNSFQSDSLSKTY